MKITHIDIWKYSIPMHPFTIATGTCYFAQNTFIRVHTEKNGYGVGECSAFPMITGETQATCFEMAKDFATIWKHQNAADIPARLAELHAFADFNATIKSAFDMALYDLAARDAGLPLVQFLGGRPRPMETDLTIGIDSPEKMAEKAIDFVERGVKMIKVKLGKSVKDDIRRIQLIREAIGSGYILRIDANQGWSFDEAAEALRALGEFDIEFCEQPMRRWNDDRLPELRQISPIPIMADESVFNHYDAIRLLKADACDSVNIKMAKSGGIHEALKIHEVCREAAVPCMMGGMLESRVALTAFAHFASAMNNIRYFDMDTCLLGHLDDPVTGGVRYNGFMVELPDTPGIGADVNNQFLDKLEHVRI